MTVNEKRRLFAYLSLALIPILVLAALFPQRLLREPRAIEQLYSVPGAAIVAFIQYECPHCQQFKKFALHQGWPVEYHEISSTEGRDLFTQLRTRVPALAYATPTIIVNGHIFQGYTTDEDTGQVIKKVHAACTAAPHGCLQFATLLATPPKDPHVTAGTATFCPFDTPTASCGRDERYVLDIWLLGPVDLQQLSLPLLSILVGFLDGFNPCAMWVLVTLLTLLIALNDLRKMVLIGCTFLLVSGLMYYLFIAAWLNVFLLIGYNFWVQKTMGLIAVGAGGFYLYEAFGTDPNACKVTDLHQRHRLTERLRKILQQSAWPLMLGGVAVLAVSVNMIELVCTAGLPAIYTQILANNQVSPLLKHLYLLLYIVLYMLDDFIIFTIAIITLQATGLTTKYRFLTLILGGALMYLLGILMIFFPDALVFAG